MDLLIALPALAILLLSIFVGQPWKRGISIASSFVYILVAILLFVIPSFIPITTSNPGYGSPTGLVRTFYYGLALVTFFPLSVVMLCIDLLVSRQKIVLGNGTKIICGLIYIATLTIFLWGFNLALK
ncbi:MAG: hypothetical protein O3A36_00225 [bacterium]|nr:hypothetical protein [bacterium]